MSPCTLVNRRSLLLGAAGLPAAAMLAACTTGEDPGVQIELRVTVDTWAAGDGPPPSPEPTPRVTPTPRIERVGPGDSFTRTLLGEEVTFSVRSVKNDRLVLVSSMPLSPEGDKPGSHKLSKRESTLKISKGRATSWATPSMDAGATIIFVW